MNVDVFHSDLIDLRSEDGLRCPINSTRDTCSSDKEFYVGGPGTLINICGDQNVCINVEFRFHAIATYCTKTITRGTELFVCLPVTRRSTSAQRFWLRVVNPTTKTNQTESQCNSTNKKKNKKKTFPLRIRHWVHVWVFGSRFYVCGVMYLIFWAKNKVKCHH